MVDMESLLIELSEAHGPSGFEESVRKIMRRELTPLTDSISTDGIGSLIGVKGLSKQKLKVMLSAHMDEVGLMVRYITDEGFIKFQTLGGWLDQAMIGQRWEIHTSEGPIEGITGIKTPLVMSSEERNNVFKRDGLFIDVGASNKKDAEQRLKINPGDPISPQSKAVRLNKSNNIIGKAWDDRAGLAVMIGVMEALKENDLPISLYAVATVQEEIGLRGAHTSSHFVAPDLGINLESGVAGDYPGITKYEAQEKIGCGPAIFLHDSSMLPNLKFRDEVVKIATSKNIPLQFNVLSGYGQDGAEMQKVNDGTPVVNVTVPTRYLHSHNSLINLNDVTNAVKLVTEIVKTLSNEKINHLRSFE